MMGAENVLVPDLSPKEYMAYSVPGLLKISSRNSEIDAATYIPFIAHDYIGMQITSMSI